jgi:hypothetical protein
MVINFESNVMIATYKHTYLVKSIVVLFMTLILPLVCCRHNTVFLLRSGHKYIFTVLKIY